MNTITQTPDLGVKQLTPSFFTSPSDRSSVRTTFNLSEKALIRKAWLAGHWRISQKDVLDHVAEAARIVTSIGSLDAFEILPDVQDRGDAKRQTHVASRGALRVFEEVAEQQQKSRDEVVDRMLLVLGMQCRDEAEEELQRREEAQEMIREFFTDTGALLDQLEDLLGEDDPVVRRMDHIDTAIMNLVRAIEAERDKGTPIDPEDLSQSK